jgi:hypothetical protein
MSADATPAPSSTPITAAARSELAVSAAVALPSRVCTPSTTVAVSGAATTVPVARAVMPGGSTVPGGAAVAVVHPGSVRVASASSVRAARCMLQGRNGRRIGCTTGAPRAGSCDLVLIRTKRQLISCGAG